MSGADDTKMTAGLFARRSRLSSKALRLYDEMGLLRPAAVDPRNGYRYYDEGQIEPARLIGLLRRLEMPLGEIREVIELDADGAVKAVSEYWQRVESGHGDKRKLARYLIQQLSRKGHTMFTIEQRQVPEQSIATVERRVLVNDLPGFIDEGMSTVYDLLGESGVDTGTPFVVYHGEVNTDSDGPVEVCVPYEGRVEPRSSVRLRVEPAHREAYARLTKRQVAFPEILSAYEAVDGWIHDAGLRIAGSPREVYFADWGAVEDDDAACDVAFPVEDPTTPA